MAQEAQKFNCKSSLFRKATGNEMNMICSYLLKAYNIQSDRVKQMADQDGKSNQIWSLEINRSSDIKIMLWINQVLNEYLKCMFPKDWMNSLDQFCSY